MTHGVNSIVTPEDLVERERSRGYFAIQKKSGIHFARPDEIGFDPKKVEKDSLARGVPVVLYHAKDS